MDNSKKFAVMLDKAICQESDGFGNFDKTKNVQDQLQEMIIKKQGWQLHPRDIKTLLHNVCLSIEKGLLPFNKPGYYSMEQLWLAFVMKEKYQKVWSTTKKDWVAR